MTTLPEVRIRAIEPEDLDALYIIENDEELWNVGTTNVPYSRYALHDFVAHSAGDIFQDKQVRLMIEDGQNEVIGIIDVMNFDPQHLRAEVGIVIQKPWRNRHYGTAAVTKIGKYALQVLHLHQLYAYIGADNHASLRLFEKCGFSHASTLQDWLYDGKKYHDAVVMQKIF